MDRVAKSGIAAHWSYKEGHRIDENISKKFAWIQDLVDNQESFRDPGEFLENVRIDLFPDEVYVFTPKGDIRALPKGATPVDFAYLIHTEVGQKCVGAKVNGQMVSLPYQLRTGDIVEIVTAKNHTPSKDWLKFVKTIKARSKIRQWIKAQEKERSISLGREMLEKAFRKEKLNFITLSKTDPMNAVVESLGVKTLDDLVANVGYGKLTPLQVLRPFMENAALEIQRAMQFFFTSTQFNSVEHILLTGGTSTLAGFEDVVSSRTRINAMVANPFANMSISPRIQLKKLISDAPALMIACGLAMRRFDE